MPHDIPMPHEFFLHQNYPNPFNPTTTINYDLPEQAQVTLSIYNLLGKQIKTLVNQSQDAGNKIAMWDGTDDLGRQVSAGVYLYQIQAGEFSQTRKMLLLK
jgi:flagellar hook assembly protein FlgD